MIRRLVSFLLIASLLVLCCPLLTASADEAASGKAGLKITGSTVVGVGKKVTLKASAKVTWESSDKKIATVSKSGVVKGIKTGKVKITAKTKDGATVVWKMTVKAPVKSVALSAPVTELNLSGTKTVTLKAKASPAKAAQKFTWKSSDTSVAEVSSGGKVTAKKAGTVTVTATAMDGSKKKASILITVTGDPYGKYLTALNGMEGVMAENPWSLQKIKDAFIAEYGSAAAVDALEHQRSYYIEKDGVRLKYMHGDWYYDYTVIYLNSAGNTLFRLEYTSVVNPADCNPNEPTYTNWTVAGLTFIPLSTSRASYHLYYGDSEWNKSNIYYDMRYYDSVTVRSLFTLSDDVYYRGVPD